MFKHSMDNFQFNIFPHRSLEFTFLGCPQLIISSCIYHIPANLDIFFPDCLNNENNYYIFIFSSQLG